MPASPFSILVTGASGFLGTNLTQHLVKKGMKIKAQYFNTPPTDKDLHPDIEWIKCDLLDIFQVENLLEGVTHIYHCAAWISYLPKDKTKMVQNNLNATANLVNECILKKIEKLVHVSSIAAVGKNRISGESGEVDLFTEATSNSTYGLSKYLSEMEVWRGMSEGLNAVIVNPGIILGQGANFKNGSGQLMRLAYNQFPYYSSGQTGWVDVDDVSRVMIKLMESDLCDERFILIESNRTFRSVMTDMALILGKNPPYLKATKFLTNLLWRWQNLIFKTTGKRPSITKESARTAHARSTYKADKIKAQFPDFNFKPFSETLQEMGHDFMTTLDPRIEK